MWGNSIVRSSRASLLSLAQDLVIERRKSALDHSSRQLGFSFQQAKKNELGQSLDPEDQGSFRTKTTERVELTNSLRHYGTGSFYKALKPKQGILNHSCGECKFTHSILRAGAQSDLESQDLNEKPV